MINRVKVSSKNQIAIPAEVRKDLDIEPGDYLLCYVRDGHLVIIPEPKDQDIVTHLRGLHREIWEGEDAQEYVNRERAEWKN